MIMGFRLDGPIPMLYALEKSSEWRRQNPDIEPIPVKVAIFLKSLNRFQQAYADLIKEGVNVFGMRKVHVELFSGVYKQALSWLLST